MLTSLTPEFFERFALLFTATLVLVFMATTAADALVVRLQRNRAARRQVTPPQGPAPQPRIPAGRF
ncbi:hypothetical protein G5C51_01020 [Streptomyces sp. A7024]|uniref:Uncharacterized protein n=1 Tax=Streptomyces coryli TaxID=1128680 RepID=A0A6G4TRM0_9ACTN|nr:hypothetical protein [Streptomyces coryli]NGN62494.1 hypothetical protein [Streptomyces coryli]